jgi:hypothetical protein
MIFYKLKVLETEFLLKLMVFLSFCRQIKIKKNPFDELSRPKAVSCKKMSNHTSLRSTTEK